VETLEGALDAAREGDLEGVVEQIQRANQRVLERGGSDRELRGMGTTLTALFTGDGKAHIAHVGDSRAYRLRDDTLQQLTEDHTLVQRMVREGKLSEDEAATHPQRNILTRVLGVEDDLPVDQLTLDVREGDRLLLCTDGLTNMVDRDRIQEILRSEPEPQAACDRLIDAANRAGGDDNITVIVVDLVAGDADGTEAPPRRSSVSSPGGGTRTAEGDSAEADRSRGAVAEAPQDQRRRRRRRVAIWAGAILVVLGVGLIAARV
jgi:protein phosphatase